MFWNRNIEMVIINVLILCICIWLFKKRNILGSYGNLMIAAMVLTYIIDCISFYMRLDKSIDQIYKLYVYIFGGLGLFFLLIFLMYQKLLKDKVLKNIATTITVLFSLFFIFQILTFDIKDGFPEILLFFNVFLLLFMIALFLLDTFQTDLILELKNYFPFWFSLGLIIIYLGIIPSIIINDMPKSELTGKLWALIMFIVNFLGYGLIFVGLLKAKKLEK